MALYFKCCARYDKIQENGAMKKVTESYLVNAMSHSEAEARFIEEITPYISGEFEVSVVRKTKIAEIFNVDADRYYLAKVCFISVDAVAGIEKRTITPILVGGENFKDALSVLEGEMSNTMADWEIVSFAESPILEVFIEKFA